MHEQGKSRDSRRTSALTARRRIHRGLVCLASAIGLLTAELVTGAGTPATAFIICDPSVNVFVWDGSANDPPGRTGDNRNWDNAYNWDVNCTPGLLNQPHDDVVRIPTGAHVFLRDGESANIFALHNRGALTVTTGAWLVTLHNSKSKALTLRGGLASRGRFTVTSILRWTSTANGAATQATRRCPAPGQPPTAAEQDCSSPVARRVGRTIIAKGATMKINGRGVNLSDQRVIVNHGTVELSNGGYIAADDGTGLLNVRDARSTGRFVIRNDRGYYQGFTAQDLGWSVGLSNFTNTGTVIKVAGHGVSLIAADFSNRDPNSRYTGRVVARSGTLSIYTPSGTSTIRKATVQGGSTFGNGAPLGESCDPALSPCAVAPTGDDPQVTTVQVAKHVSASTPVTIQELKAGERGDPVRIETPNVSAVAGMRHPLRFRLMLDATERNPGETASGLARTAKIFRQAKRTRPYVRLPNCPSSQKPTASRPTCVARRLSVDETRALANGDVVLVVSSLQNSRYRVSG